MQLTSDQLQQLINRLEVRWTGPRRCPICDSQEWTLHDRLYELLEFERGRVNLGGAVIPVAVMQCDNCGHTNLFNALALDFIDLGPEEIESDDAK